MKKRKYLLSLKSLEKKSKASLLRLIMKHLKTKSKKSLARIAYSMAKSKLPRLRKRKQMGKYGHEGGKYGIDYIKDDYTGFRRLPIKRKTKRKFSPKQLAAQRLFAKRAKAGTFRRKQRRAKGKRRFN